MDVKMDSRIITKNYADDSKIGSPVKIDFRTNWTHEFHPTAWELRSKNITISVFIIEKSRTVHSKCIFFVDSSLSLI